MDEDKYIARDLVYVDVPEVCYEEYVLDEEDGGMHEIAAHNVSINDGYGGMPDEMYNGIVQYIKSGTLPDFVLTNDDRNARSHWKMKCAKYELRFENLIYCNKDSEGGSKPRFVVRKGEVLPILTAVHNKIGHLGMKRTQAAVLQCFYWYSFLFVLLLNLYYRRSVRADVQKFVGSCSFCNHKKKTGRKVLKAPLDVFDPDVLQVGINVNYPSINGDYYGAGRFVISLRGIPDNVALTRTKLSNYSFKQRYPAVKRGREIANKAHHIPLGHSLDGFHEIHSAAADIFFGNWIPDNDTCRKPRTRRKGYERPNDQTLAADTLNQLPILSGKLSPKSEIFADEQVIDPVSTLSTIMARNGTPSQTYWPVANGLAARSFAENQLKVDYTDSDYKTPQNIYEFNIEHWHLPPTYGT
ncbi:hypothetical protein DdX_11591 [Ditylenchus destructor]|uniref:Integrase zinc-binding domain-containing protein n=1 Tax=Ditylenchus destructor TaxID=166010 RepID=A0AAD4MYH0_9BILA|nr:hypothetical protein DdX_11591 [Ditylenchus destructor]